MLPSDATLSSDGAAKYPAMPDWEYDDNIIKHRIYDTTGDVAYGSAKSVRYGYTDAAGNYKQDTINDTFGTIPGSLIKSLRAAMGLVDAPHVASAQAAAPPAQQPAQSAAAAAAEARRVYLAQEQQQADARGMSLEEWLESIGG
jgi:hypothetical protein